MISFTYIKLVLTKRVITVDKWESAIEKIVPALRNIDFDDDGTITVRELLRAVKNAVLAVL